MQWQKDIDLTHRNSFGFPTVADHFAEVDQIADLELALDAVEKNGWPLLILGGGSNLVFREKIPGAVLSVAKQGLNILADNEHTAIVEVGAGENWHGFVTQLLQKGLHGLENLALIPGSVGAAPVQNIGAYGVEIADCFHSLTAYDRINKELVQLSKEECQFGYRDSLFKSGAKGRYIIWTVRFALSTIFTPKIGYKGIADHLDALGVIEPSAYQVYQAVCDIRMSKLPLPAELGNAGSFFENPIVTKSTYQRLKNQFPDIVAYPDKAGHFKLAAGWLIDRAGWKGCRVGEVGVYDKQALVLVNYGQGLATDLLKLADDISLSVRKQFDVKLKIEPRIYPE